jgi:hypothetical protein
MYAFLAMPRLPTGYLRHELALVDLVAWADTTMMDGEFEPQHFAAIRDVGHVWVWPMSARSV